MAWKKSRGREKGTERISCFLLKSFTFKACTGQETMVPNPNRARRKSFELQGDFIVAAQHEGHLAADVPEVN